ncbi:MAG TPA: tRNA dihydrouridine synthase DusB [Gammaproteobacteria bacterium]|nr:tRNA dihydrouridine synthase DusB [Gammaproteobacteria bacterium]
MKIGPYAFSNAVILAPMAGITDRPFRNLCYQLGADLCVSEMVTSQKHLWRSKKTRLRLNHEGEAGIRSVQIAGTDPLQMAEAARFNASRGAQIIDINMGCPAKKVCNVQAGSALLKNETLVADILQAVVSAVEVPVTLKIRTGWDRHNRNAVSIARIAQDCGIRALTVHGRTRADAYRGEAEYETIAAVKAVSSIPVIANGDITGPQKARDVLAQTGADALMIGRGAQGDPWIFTRIKHFLETGRLPALPDNGEIADIVSQHLKNLYNFYGEPSGVRIARKHIGWYLKRWCPPEQAEIFRKSINQIDDSQQQYRLVKDFFMTQPTLLAA